MSKFHCPHCGEDFEMPFWKWLFTAPFHRFVFCEWRDYRKTKCPNCGERSWMKRIG